MVDFDYLLENTLAEPKKHRSAIFILQIYRPWFNFFTNICKKQTHTRKTLYICHLAHILHYNIVF